MFSVDLSRIPIKNTDVFLNKYVASVGNINKQQKFYSLPKRYNKIWCFENLWQYSQLTAFVYNF